MLQRQDMDYKYKIYPISQLDSIDWTKFTHSPETCRKSFDGSEFIVRFKNEPDTDYLTHNEALAVMLEVEWYIEDDYPEDEYPEEE